MSSKYKLLLITLLLDLLVIYFTFVDFQAIFPWTSLTVYCISSISRMQRWKAMALARAKFQQNRPKNISKCSASSSNAVAICI